MSAAGHDPCAVWRESVAQHKEALRTALARAEAAEATVERVRALVADPLVILNVGEIALRYARVRDALDGEGS